MKRIILTALCALLITGPAYAAESFDEAAAAKMAKMFPKTIIDGFSPSPVSGLYEVTAGSQIFYFTPEGYLVFGEIWSKDGKNVTAERRDQIIAEKVKTLPLDKAVTIGNGPNKVIEFTDPDCPYCRKLDAYLSGRKDITRHIFFFPLNIHPKAKDKAQYILCSENQQTAKREVFSGKWDKDLPPSNNCSATLLDDHLRSAGVVGVRGTPTLWINGTKIGGANIEAIASILDNSKTKAQQAQKKEINP